MKRRKIGQASRNAIISRQRGYCRYCGQAFGEMAWYRKPVVLKAHIEHVVPFALAGYEKDDNLVAACQICNQMKRAKIFSSAHEMLVYIAGKWATNGTMTSNRTKVKRIQGLDYWYGKNLGKYEDLTQSQKAFIRKMIREGREKIKADRGEPTEIFCVEPEDEIDAVVVIL